MVHSLNAPTTIRLVPERLSITSSSKPTVPPFTQAPEAKIDGQRSLERGVVGGQVLRVLITQGRRDAAHYGIGAAAGLEVLERLDLVGLRFARQGGIRRHPL